MAISSTRSCGGSSPLVSVSSTKNRVRRTRSEKCTVGAILGGMGVGFGVDSGVRCLLGVVVIGTSETGVAGCLVSQARAVCTLVCCDVACTSACGLIDHSDDLRRDGPVIKGDLNDTRRNFGVRRSCTVFSSGAPAFSRTTCSQM